MKKALGNVLTSVEDEEIKHQHFLAFCDFCRDLLEEKYGAMAPDGEINPKGVKGLLVHT